MRFRVTRTSAWHDHEAPIDGTEAGTYATSQNYGRITEEQVIQRSAALNPSSIMSTATGWTVEYEARGWFIDIDTLDDLIQFVDKADNEVIIRGHHERPILLEIYDDYRE